MHRPGGNCATSWLTTATPWRRTQPKERARVATGGTVFSSPAVTDDGLILFGSHDRSIRAVALDEAKPHGVDVRWTRPTGDMVWCAPALGPAPGNGGGGAAGSPEDLSTDLRRRRRASAGAGSRIAR